MISPEEINEIKDRINKVSENIDEIIKQAKIKTMSSEDHDIIIELIHERNMWSIFANNIKDDFTLDMDGYMADRLKYNNELGSAAFDEVKKLKVEK